MSRQRFERTLLLLKHYLGDAVMVTPLMAKLSEESSVVDVLTGGGAPELLQNLHPNVGFEKEGKLRGLGALLRKAKELEARQYDAAFVVNRSFRSALLAKLARIPVRAGHSTDWRGPLLTHSLPYDPVKNEAECYNDLYRTVVGDVPFIKPRLIVTEQERARSSLLLKGAVIGMQPGARYPEKQLPLQKLAEVANRLAAPVALFGGPEEQPHAETFKALLDTPPIDLVGKLSLRETMGALANLRLMVGNDTGVMHVAAGVGCPCVTLFGPTPSSKWGHTGASNQVLQAPDGAIDRLEPQLIWEAACRVLERQ